MKQYGLKIVRGNAEAPQLPNGWTLKRNPDDACVATSPQGVEYLIGDGVLYPWRTCPPEGLPNSTLKSGDKYIATEDAIKWPNQSHPTAAGVPDAVLKVEGDVILISDHENKMLLNRKSALELLERLPGLIAKLPLDAKPSNVES